MQVCAYLGLTQTYVAIVIVGGIARVINVSSITHLFAPAGGVNYASLVPHCEAADKIRDALGPERLYAQSKWVSGPYDPLYN